MQQQVLNIFSAGAAQSIVSALVIAMQDKEGQMACASFGAVQTMKARVLAGEPADVVILTGELIDELIDRGEVLPRSRVDLGAVATGVAVRIDVPVPDIAGADRLRAVMLEASRIVCPDPAVATAGRVLLEVLSRLGILEQLRPRLAYFPSGYSAVAGLMEGACDGEIGVMQVTEIVAHSSVVLAGILPNGPHDAVAVYAAGIATRSTAPDRSAAFIRRLAGDPVRLQRAGFQSPRPLKLETGDPGAPGTT